MGEHCGVSADETARALKRARNSIVVVADTLSAKGHSLRQINDGDPDEGEFSDFIEELADPSEPFQISVIRRSVWQHMFTAVSGAVWKIVFAILLIALLTLAWYVSPLADWADPNEVRDWFKSANRQPWAGVLVIGTFLAGGLAAFPVTILIAATAATFGPWYGFLYATLGVLASALATYAIGAQFGQRALRRILGQRLDRIREKIERQGVLAVAAVRIVPVAPFTFVNLVAGASAIKLVDYVAGTVLGMLPGLVVMSALGDRIVAILSDPSIGEVALLAAAVIGWIGVSLAVQSFVSRVWRRTS